LIGEVTAGTPAVWVCRALQLVAQGRLFYAVAAFVYKTIVKHLFKAAYQVVI